MKSHFLIIKYLFICFVIVLSSCDSSQTKNVESKNTLASKKLINHYTRGVISRDESIVVGFTQAFPQGLINDITTCDCFKISPSVDGTLKLLSNSSFSFAPTNRFESGVAYEVKLDLEKIFTDETAEAFYFSIQTIAQDFSVAIEGLTPYNSSDLSKNKISTLLECADRIDTNNIKNILSVKDNGTSLPVKWYLSGSNKYQLVIDSVSRGKEAKELTLTWNGKVIGVDKSINKIFEIPSLTDFKVLGATVANGDEQYITVRFSDPILSQNLKGLVTIDGVNDPSFQVSGSELMVYPKTRIYGNMKINVAKEVKNVNGYQLEKAFETSLAFYELKPVAKIGGDGTFLPVEGKILVPIDVVSLNYVDIIVSQVYANNMLQFLQTNNYNGNYQFSRVGKIVAQKRINLKNSGKNLRQLNRFMIDLSDIITVEAGAVYRVETRFLQPYAAYQCNGKLLATPESELPSLSELLRGESNVANDDSDGYDEYYEYDDYNYYSSTYWNYEYNWSERDNPCHSYYYRSDNASSSKNFIASNLGLLVKKGSNNEVLVFVNDLVTAAPKADVFVHFYDYQQQLITQGKTDKQGILKIEVKGTPAFASASAGKSKTFIKLGDAESLSMSKFDVAGTKTKNGIKGLIYGERGVWRPGDSLYLSFMMLDVEKSLPADYPVHFELINPRGIVVKHTILTNHVNWVYNCNTATESNAITGNYIAKVKVGGQEFTKRIKIETIKPNRLKIKLAAENELLSKKNNNRLKLQVNWLHGLVAKDMLVTSELNLSATHTSFDGFANYCFDDKELKSFSLVNKKVFEGRTDETGFVSFETGISAGTSVPGMLQANYKTKVFENGGGFSEDFKSFKYSPYTSYVGIKVPDGKLWGGAIETDTDANLLFAAVSENGIPEDENIEVTIYKINWRWWWDSPEENLANYIKRNGRSEVYKNQLKTNNGKASIDFRVAKNEWGRYLVVAKHKTSGHVASKIIYFDWPYWARSNRSNKEAATVLGFSSDKNKYNVGETAQISFPSSVGAKALLTIENGTKVLNHYVLNTDENETKFELPITAEMQPNIYVHITYIQPHKVTNNDLPIRMFGVIPILVDNQENVVKPSVTVPKEIKPLSKYTIKVSEATGKKMTYTLAVVDEGLLDLTHFQTPNPKNHFYAREALGVRTWDMYDHIISAKNMALNNLLSIGGDQENAIAGNKKANRFKPVVQFIGPFELEKGKEKTHEFTMSNYIGSVRVMVVARNEGAFGVFEKAVPVKKPVMVQATLPRALGPKEKVKMPITVFALDEKVKNAKVRVKTNNLVKIIGNKEFTVNFSEPGDETIFVELEALNKIGIAEIEVSVEGGGDQAYEKTELDIRLSNPVYTQTTDTTLRANNTVNIVVEKNGVDGTNNLAVELSTFPALNLESRLSYLIGYPHGCIEQTTSKAFPQLFLENLVKLSADQQLDIEDNIRYALQRLTRFQTMNGGFAYWPGNAEANDWGTNYAGHFMLLAEQKGFALPINLKENWLSFQKEQARKWSTSKGNQSWNEHTQAYRLYTLALAGSPEYGAMNRLREMGVSSNMAKWRLALAYFLIGQKQIANQLIVDLPTYVATYRETGYTYGSNVRDIAMILETLVYMNKMSEADKVAKELANNIGSNRWMSTHTASYSLHALATYMKKSNPSNEIKATITFGNKTVEVNSSEPFSLSKFKETDWVNNTLTIKSKVGGSLYARITNKGIPIENKIPAVQENLNMQVFYKDLQGKEIDIKHLKLSQDFIAEVRIKNKGVNGSILNLALEQIFPAGWEIMRDRLNDNDLQKESNYDYRDIRDDRVFTYFWLQRNEERIFTIKLNATYPGYYYLPSISCGAMYDDGIQANTNGYWVDVVR
jgi:uncharacterized protein YfaS (alpha-2-macroglobulin family)